MGNRVGITGRDLDRLIDRHTDRTHTRLRWGWVEGGVGMGRE